MVPMEERDIKIIRLAAKLLEERGWCQGTMEDEQGRMCLLGALSTAREQLSGLYGIAYEVYGPLFDAIQSRTKEYLHGMTKVGRWNDWKGRTKEEVIAILHSVADSAVAAGACSATSRHAFCGIESDHAPGVRSPRVAK